MQDSERNFVEIWFNELSKVVEKVELDLNLELKRIYPENFENKRGELNQKHQNTHNILEKRLLRKISNIKQEEILP